MKILITDDDAATRMLLLAMLSSLGHDCSEAPDGAAAWASFLQDRPDVVITDRNMPELDGLELCRRIRSHAEGHRTAVILVTGDDKEHEVLEGVEAGADDYLVKPVSAFALRVRLIAAERLVSLHGRLHDAAAALENKNEELALTARTDALTGIGNRRRFEEDLAATDANVGRVGGSYAVAIADVDRFKSYNDRLGHQAGDAALRAVADALTGSCRRGDRVYRYGGEEFAIIYNSAPAPADVAKATERARAAVTALAPPPRSAEGGIERLTISIGLAWPLPGREHPEEVVAAADAALYEAKNRGRNRVVVAPIPETVDAR